MTRTPSSMFRIAGVLALGLLTLAGCEDGGFKLGDSLGLNQTSDDAGTSASGATVEREIEAPDVFSVTEAGLWDGRPSLGGVWVAHPDVTEPERVIIRNTANGKFVVGALFRREREIPGPRLQVSSDAATALNMLAGAPSDLNVTALRREQVAVDATEQAPQEVDQIAAPEDIEAANLDPIIAAGAAIDAASSQPAPTQPVEQPRSSSLTKPYIQVGIFSVQANANRTADQMRAAGMVPSIRQGETSGKAFWRVIVGPANTSQERTALLNKIRNVGFTDAYPVTN